MWEGYWRTTGQCNTPWLVKVGLSRPEGQRERGVTESLRYRAYLERATPQETLEKRLSQHMVTLQGTSWEVKFLTTLSTTYSQRTREPFDVINTGQIPWDVEQGGGGWRLNPNGKMERFLANKQGPCQQYSLGVVPAVRKGTPIQLLLHCEEEGKRHIVFRGLIPARLGFVQAGLLK